jgi:hypothetical protein
MRRSSPAPDDAADLPPIAGLPVDRFHGSRSVGTLDAKYQFINDNGQTKPVSCAAHFANALGQKYPEFQLVRGIANASKHFVLHPIPTHRGCRATLLTRTSREQRFSVNQHDMLLSVPYTADQAFAARATAAQPHHLGIGSGLVDEYEPGRTSMACSRFSTPARPDDVLALLLRREQAFFEGDLVALEEAPDRAAATWNRVLVHRGDHLIQGQVRLLGNQCEQPFCVLLQRRRAPTARLGTTQHPVSRKHFTHLTAALG